MGLCFGLLFVDKVEDHVRRLLQGYVQLLDIDARLSLSAENVKRQLRSVEEAHRRRLGLQQALYLGLARDI